MKTIIVSIGEAQLAKATVLAGKLDDAIVVSSATILPAHAHENQFLAAHRAKAGFAGYLPEGYEGPVCLMDCDIVVMPGVFAELPEITSGVAGVCVLPANRPVVLPAPFVWETMVNPLNSGFLVFQTAAAAKQISAAWFALYTSYHDVTSRDEVGLYKALAQLGITPQYLDPKFNSTDVATGLVLHGRQFKWADIDRRTAPPRVSSRPLVLSKLKIRRMLRDQGIESLLDAFLASSQTAAADWNDAQNLLSNDPMLAASIPSFALATGLTEAQILSLMAECVAE